MKKVLFSLLLTFFIIDFTHAQVGVNTVTPNAMLDIKASNQATPANTDGILIPKIDAFPAINPTAAQKGMLVYLTTLSGGNQPGFYYWNNPGWVGISSDSSAWKLTGNAGTNQLTHFIGTTDNQDLIFKRDGNKMGYIGTSNIAFGNFALSSFGGSDNIAFGSNALSAAIGSDNIGIGRSALSFNTGTFNVALGSGSLFFNTGSNNIAVGTGSLVNNTSGSNNLGIGQSALATNTSGSNNIGIGSGAGSNITLGSNNITIGTNANAVFALGSNQLNIGDLLFGNTGATKNLGINAISPKGMLDVESTTNGILIPRIALTATNVSAPVVNPQGGALATSTLIYNTATAGVSPNSVVPGFYFWDNAAAKWIPIISGNLGGTLDQAYDFGGAGNGRSVTADAGAVTIAGTDGLVSTGLLGSGALAPSGLGTRMVWNPNKGAFRAGNVASTNWNDINIGVYSAAFGNNTRAIGTSSSAFGSGTHANGFGSSAFGDSSAASGLASTAFGNATTADGPNSSTFGLLTDANGINSTAFGDITTANGRNTTSFGYNNTSQSFSETVFGIGATIYTTSANGALEFKTVNATDRLFVIGNAIDSNNNNSVDASERSDALVILKNGNTGIGSSTPQDKLHVVGNIRMVDGNQAAGKVLTSDTNGTATWQTPATAGTTLDGAYDFGGAGAGKTITADAGAVLIDGTDGLVSTGTWNSGSIAPSGSGTRMVWNPRKGAFRAGRVLGTQWDDASVGDFSVAFGAGGLASGTASTSFGNSNQAIGGTSTAFGYFNSANGNTSTAMGIQNTAASTGETVIGIGATTYTISPLGATRFGAANATDRLFVVGNAIDTNNNLVLDVAERSDALVILKNGNTGIGSSTPQDKLHVVGNIRMVDGNQAAGKVLTSDANGTATWMATTASAWGLNGNTGTNPTNNFVGTVDAQPLLFRTGNTFAGQLGSTGTALVSYGRGAGAAVTASAAQVTAIGVGAGAGNTDGDANTYVGANAGAAMTTGFYSTYVGADAGRFASASNNAFFGYQAGGLAGLTGGLNTFVGSQAGLRNTSGNGNTFMGFDAGSSTTSGSQNVFIGREAGQLAQTVSASVFVGSFAGSETTVSDNTFVGGSAGRLNTTGNNNAFFGNSAGIGNLVGSDNTFVGNNSGAANLASNNTFIGSRSGDSNTAGTRNTYMGASAGTGNNTGNDTTFIGFEAGKLTTGSDSTFIGSGSGDANTTGASNTFIGKDSGNTNITGNNNVMIGDGADIVTSALSNATAIGSRATAGNSNVVILGSINGVNGATSSVNVGIGTNNPNSTLEIVDSNVVTSGTAEGNLNVASNDPQNTDIGASITLSGIASGGAQRVFASVEGRKSNAGAASDSGYLAFKTNSVGTLAERMRITNVGDVGIGTAAPGGQFELSLNEGRKPGTNTWTIVSDQRLKNVNGNYTKGLNEILQLKPVRYNYKNSGSRTFEKEVLDTEFAGFLAQEVQPLFPEAVGTDDDGFLNFNIHPILIASVNALKELSAKNEQLEQKSSQLEKENQLLKESVQAINDKMLLIIAEMEMLKK